MTATKHLQKKKLKKNGGGYHRMAAAIFAGTVAAVSVLAKIEVNCNLKHIFIVKNKKTNENNDFREHQVSQFCFFTILNLNFRLNISKTRFELFIKGV